MKKTNKILVFLIAIICVAMLVISVTGYTKQYGDVSSTVLYPLRSTVPGNEYANGYEFSVQPVAELSESDFQSAVQTLSTRLQYLGVPDFEMFRDKNTNAVTVRLPSGTVQTFGSSMISSTLSTAGSFEVRRGANTDDNGMPAGETALEPIVTNSNVKTVHITRSNLYVSSNVVYQMTLILDHAGSVSLGSATSQLANTSSGYISYWIDGEMIGYSSVSAPITDGTLTIHSSVLDYSTATLYGVYMKSGALPVQFNLISSSMVTYGSNSVLLLIYLFGAASLLTAAYFIIRYKVLSIAPIIGLAGLLAVLFMSFTGLISSALSSVINSITWIVPAAVLIIYAVGMNWLCASADSGISQGTPADIQLKNSFSDLLKSSAPLYACLAVTGLVMSYVLGYQVNWATKIFSGLMTTDVMVSFADLGHLIFVSSLSLFVFTYLVPMLCTSSLLNFKLFDKYSLKTKEKAE